MPGNNRRIFIPEQFAPDMSDEQKASSTYVARDSQPLVVYEPYHEPTLTVLNGKLKLTSPDAATVSYRKQVANRGKTDELRLQEYTNNAIAQAQSQLDNDLVYKFAKTAGDVINEARHIVPAMLMNTGRVNPLLFGAGAAWEGANLAYDAYHNDTPGMYRSVFEPAGFAVLDAAVNPATWQFLGNTAKRAGSYVYNRAINPIALFVNNRVVRPATLLVSSLRNRTLTYPWVGSSTLDYAPLEARVMYFDLPNEPRLVTDYPEVSYSMTSPVNLAGERVPLVKEEITSENAHDFRDAVHGVRDAQKHWSSPEAEALALRLEAEAIQLGLTYTNPTKQKMPIESIEFFKDPKIKGKMFGGLTYVEHGKPTPVGFFNTPYFRGNPYSIGFHEGTHSQYAGYPIYGDASATVDNSVLYNKKINDVVDKTLPTVQARMSYVLLHYPIDYLYIEGILNDPHEYIAYMVQAGKELGVKEFAPYPGDEAMILFIDKNKGKNLVFDLIIMLAEYNHKALKGIWDSLAGNYIMGTAGVVAGGAALYNMFNNNNSDLNIH